MNILFISKLTGKLWAGPHNSVPAQVLAQSNIDNVLWVNLNYVCLPNWRRDEYQFINYDDIPKCSLEVLPKPFNKPDFIIFEEIYTFHPRDKMVVSVLKSGIPYSIIPRCSLTKNAQHRHFIKKKLANILFYNRFVFKSHFVQYLTPSEKIESEKYFNHKNIIIPNGIDLPHIVNKDFSQDGIRAIYIGRLEIGQKGLDLLLKAIVSIKEELRYVRFSMTLYGPDIEHSVEKLKSIIQDNHIDDLIKIKDGIFGEDKINILKNSDIFIMTSRYEGMPMGLIEALSYGIPCIATDGTYMAEEIQKYDAGWEAGNNIDSIKTALLTAINEKNHYTRKSNNAIKLASNYSWKNLANNLHNQIQETL